MNRFTKKKKESFPIGKKFNPFDILGQFHGFTLINVNQDLKEKSIDIDFYSTESGSTLG
jgi:hypothetical protein